MNAIKDTLIRAIRAKKIIDIFYKRSWRRVEPHLLGYNQKMHLCLSAFQLSGGSGRDWRAFLVDDIKQVSISDEIFIVRHGYNPNDSNMLQILERV